MLMRVRRDPHGDNEFCSCCLGALVPVFGVGEGGVIWAWLGRAVPRSLQCRAVGLHKTIPGGEGAWDRPGPGSRARHAAPVASPVGDRAQDRGRRHGGPVAGPLRSSPPGSSQPSGAEEPTSEAIARLEAANAGLRARRSQARPGESVGSSSSRASMCRRWRRSGGTRAPVR